MRVACLLSMLCACATARLPELDATGRRALAAVSHLIVVTTASWEEPQAELSVWQRRDVGWSRVAGPFEAVVGARGLSWGRGVTRPPPEAGRIKREGDRTAPAGVFRLGRVIGYAARPPSGVELPYEQATERMRCVDDPEAVTYNQIAFAPTAGEQAWSSSEEMRREDHLYERLALVDHNGLVSDAKPVKSGGSCIFLHVWRESGKPTLGCTALSLANLDRVLAAVPSLDDVLLVQLPEAEHGAAVVAGWLPVE